MGNALLLPLLLGLGLALLLACGLVTALLWRLTQGIASHGARVLLTGLASIGLLQALLWPLMPGWWRETPSESLAMLILAQALVCSALLLLPRPLAR